MRLDLVRARLIRRYQRFLADVVLPDGTTAVAHVPNTGSMATLLHDGADAWLRPAMDPARKLKWTLVLLGTPGGGLAVVDTGLPNRVVEEGIRAGAIPELAGYPSLRREVAYGRGSRIDLLLEDVPGRRRCHIEIKNVTMLGVPGRADFPDAVTARGRKHLAELAEVARSGGRAVQFFLVDRDDCGACGIARSIDRAYAEALAEGQAAGVEIIAYRAAIAPTAITVGSRCPFLA